MFTKNKSGFTTIHDFSGSDGAKPSGALQGDGGTFLRGTTRSGGQHNFGTVFVYDLDLDHGQFGPLVLYSFTGGMDGTEPYSGLGRGNDGAFYGTTAFGGLGYGTIFRLNTTGTLTTLHRFASAGRNPAGLCCRRPMAISTVRPN